MAASLTFNSCSLALETKHWGAASRLGLEQEAKSSPREKPVLLNSLAISQIINLRGPREHGIVEEYCS